MSKSNTPAPAQKIIPRKTAPKVNDVPKSGCLKTSTAGGRINNIAQNMSVKERMGFFPSKLPE